MDWWHPGGPARSPAPGAARRWSVALGAAALSVALGACQVPTFGIPRAATHQGDRVVHLWQGSVLAAAAVGLLVWGLIVFSVVRFRRRGPAGGDLPRQTRFNIPLELTYTAIPVVIVAVLFAFTVRTQQRVDHLSAHPDLTVRVEAFQWGWRFTYDGRPSPPVQIVGNQLQHPQMVLPAHRTVRLVLTSNDVVHSFFVPAFVFKRDLIPGMTNAVEVNLDKEGTFVGHCAEFCGLNHADMGFTVLSVSPSNFDAWLAQQRGRS